MKVIYDAEEAVVGRLGTSVAKDLLKGKSVFIINSEKAIVSGDKKVIIERISDLRKKGGTSRKGPKVSKIPERLLKRMIRGMLPWDRQKGRDAYKRLKCFVGVGDLKEEDLKNLKKVQHTKPNRYITIKQISEAL